MLNSDSLKFCPPLPWIAAPGCLLVHFVNVWWPGRAPLSLCLPLPTWIFAIWGQFIFCPEEIVDLCYNVKKLKIKAVIVMMMMLMLMMLMMMMMMPLLLNWRWPPPPPFPHIGMQMRCVPGDPTMVTSTACSFSAKLGKKAALVDDGGRGHQTWISTPSCSRTESSEGVQLNVLLSTLLHNCDCRILRILLKQNTALLSTVRPSVCVCVSQAWHLSFLTYIKA